MILINFGSAMTRMLSRMNLISRAVSGIVFPVVDEGRVVSLADAIGPRFEFLLVFEVFHLQRAALLHAIGDAVHPIGQVEGCRRSDNTK